MSNENAVHTADAYVMGFTGALGEFAVVAIEGFGRENLRLGLQCQRGLEPGTRGTARYFASGSSGSWSFIPNVPAPPCDVPAPAPGFEAPEATPGTLAAVLDVLTDIIEHAPLDQQTALADQLESYCARYHGTWRKVRRGHSFGARLLDAIVGASGALIEGDEVVKG